MHEHFRRHPLEKALRAVLIFIAVAWSTAPVLFIILSSFKRQRDIFVYPPKLLFQPTVENYVKLWEQWGGFFATLGNSLIIAIGATVLAAVVSFLGGYAYSRYRSRLLAASALYMIAIRVLPPIVVTLPLFPIVDYLGLSDTHATLIILYASFWVSLNTMIMKSFIDQVPYELDEAAYVDGASEFQVLYKILLPITLQGLAAGSIIVFVFSWNEYLYALIFTANYSKTAPLIISELMGAIDGTEWGVLFAGVTIQLAPVLLLVVLAQKLLISGLMAGAVKG